MGYWNEIDKRETREIIQQERDTFHSRAQSALDDESGGRFAKITPSTVTGQSPISYPQQPSGSPWASNPVPGDPYTDQIDYDPNFVEPVSPTPPSSETSRHSVSDRPEAHSPSSGQGGSRLSPSASSQPFSKPFVRRF
jgi:hypothetical protein